jgi:2-polyprenyl-3-methyl-5-hydroxy-6-metoxy-1,4-benzoquinol methylase
MPSSYQPEAIRAYFDDLGEKEWDRLVRTPVDEVSLYIHNHYLRKHISPKAKVLEIGAGPGRFTQTLAGLEAEVLVADISGRQLELNRQLSGKHGFEKAVVDWQQLDICDLSAFESGSFDVVVAYGGPFSYVLDQRDLALAECMRVVKPGGVILLSVMSLWGTAHSALEGVLGMPPGANQKIIPTGDITAETYPGRRDNFMHLFRARELLDWLQGAGLTILDRSAANCLSLTQDDLLADIREDAKKWAELLRIELEACAEDGCLDMGTHIIAAVQKSR